MKIKHILQLCLLIIFLLSSLAIQIYNGIETNNEYRGMINSLKMIEANVEGLQSRLSHSYKELEICRQQKEECEENKLISNLGTMGRILSMYPDNEDAPKGVGGSDHPKQLKTKGD